VADRPLAPWLRRRASGFTLVELLVAIVLLAVVGAALLRLVVRTQRLTQAQAEGAALQGTLRAGAVVAPAELRELDPAADLVAMTDSTIEYRAMRGFAVLCGVSPTAVQVWADSFYSAARLPQAGRDSLLILADNDPAADSDDVWRAVPVTGAPAKDLGCGRPTLSIPVTGLDPSGIALGAPVRNTEIMSLQLYPSGGDYWLGARSVSGGETAPQPVLGPLAAGGFHLEYLDDAGAPVSTSAAVRNLRITLRGITARAVHSAGGTGQGVGRPGDSLVIRFRLSNATSS
jgi:prepilin-type N-terminal cleavage/methylation domain-containing protein